jgi:hypothetical protein
LVKQRQSIYLVRQHEANRELTEAMARLDALTDWGGRRSGPRRPARLDQCRLRRDRRCPQTMIMMMHAIYRLDTLLGPAARWLINELQAGE